MSIRRRVLTASGFALLIGVFAISAVQAKTFTLRIGSGHPSKPVAYVSSMENFFVPEVEKRVAERTEHKIKFIQGYAGTIAKVHETLEAVQKGLLDVGGWCVCFEPAKASALNLSYLVPFGSPDTRVQAAALRKILDEYPAIYSDLEERYNQKLMAVTGFDNYGLGTSFDWTEFSELKGHKILAAGPNLPWVAHSGAIPVTTTLPTAYNQLQTGIGEGIIMFPGSYFGFKFHEPAPYFTDTSFGGTAQVVLTMNLKTRQKLPADVLAIIDEVGNEYAKVATDNAMNRYQPGLDNLKKAGATVKEISDQARIDWAKSLEPFVNESVDKFDEMGLDGSAIFKRFIALQEEQNFVFPYDYQIK